MTSSSWSGTCHIAWAAGISINGDHEGLRYPPVPLSSGPRGAVFTPSLWPKYNREAFRIWEDWSLFPGPGLPGIFQDTDDDSPYIDDLFTAFEHA